MNAIHCIIIKFHGLSSGDFFLHLYIFFFGRKLTEHFAKYIQIHLDAIWTAFENMY